MAIKELKRHTVEVFKQQVEMLKTVCDSNVIHRVLNPRSTDMCKIANFGTSRVMTGDTMTMTKGQGTPLYMAPEILQGNEHYGSAVPYADYGFKNALDMQNAVVEGKRPKISKKLCKKTPAKLIELMKQCWAPDSGDRPAFGDVVSALESIHL